MISSCRDNGAAHHQSKTDIHPQQPKIQGLPLTVKSPEDNPYSDAKAALGKQLFFDPILSGDRDVACATCHHPSNGFAESRDLSIGVNGVGFGGQRRFHPNNRIPLMKKNAHTILNTAFNGMDSLGNYDPSHAPMFWDLRVQSLESQALEPIKALEEMRGSHYDEHEILVEVIKRLSRIPDYRSAFANAFAADPQPLNIDNLAKAIATYERTILGNHSRFDQYMRGDPHALSDSEKAGFNRFVTAGCANCHSGPMLTDYKIHVLGVPDHPILSERDLGYQNTHGFRTPSLRNLRFTFPYMHNGTIKSIKEVLEFYEDISQGKSRNPLIPLQEIDPLARSVDLRVKDFGPITNFLLSLNDEGFDKSVPASVPSGLEVGGSIGLHHARQ